MFLSIKADENQAKGMKPMNISVCIGSACHLKGSYPIITMLKDAISKNGLENDVTVSASFCLWQCSSEGVSVKIDDEIVTGISPENLSELFENRVLKVIKK